MAGVGRQSNLYALGTHDICSMPATSGSNTAWISPELTRRLDDRTNH